MKLFHQFQPWQNFVETVLGSVDQPAEPAPSEGEGRPYKQKHTRTHTLSESAKAYVCLRVCERGRSVVSTYILSLAMFLLAHAHTGCFRLTGKARMRILPSFFCGFPLRFMFSMRFRHCSSFSSSSSTLPARWYALLLRCGDGSASGSAINSPTLTLRTAFLVLLLFL